MIVAEGGMCGAYIRTIGETGAAKVTLYSENLEPVTLTFDIT